MAGITGNTTELLAAIRSDARIADDDPSATDADLLAEATRVLHRTYAPAVRKCRSDYYLNTALAGLEAGRAAYAIPRRATTSTVRRVRLLDAQSRVVSQLAPMSIEDMNPSVVSSAPSAYAISDNTLVLWPTPNAAASQFQLEIMFEYRPAALILPDDALGTVVLVEYDAGTWSVIIGANTVTDGMLFDVVCATSPYSVPVIDAVADATGAGFYGYGVDLVSYMGAHPTTVTGTSWLGPMSPLGIKNGDYVCRAGESPFPQIPLELHPALAMHTAAKFLRPIDPQGAADLQASADADMIAVLEAMTPRKQGAQMRMRPRVRHVRTGGGGWGRRGSFGDL